MCRCLVKRINPDSVALTLTLALTTTLPHNDGETLRRCENVWDYLTSEFHQVHFYTHTQLQLHDSGRNQNGQQFYSFKGWSTSLRS